MSEGYIAANPVKAAAPPKDRRAREVMRTLPAHEFETVVRDVAEASETYAELVSVLGRTGIRWGEARAMLVRDFVEVPMPALNVVRNQPEGTTAAKTPKSGRGRRVPLPDALVPALRRFAEGKGPDDLLLTRPGGGQLHRSTFVRQTGWSEAGDGAAPSTTSGTPPPASGSCGASPSRPCTRGSVTARSRSRHATCTTSATPPTVPRCSCSTTPPPERRASASGPSLARAEGPSRAGVIPG